MGESVHFVKAESETGGELRSSKRTELSSRYVFLVSHASNGWKAAHESGIRFREE